MSDTSTNTNTTEDTGTGTATGLQPYIQQEWSNGEEGKTPISAERLQHMETGIGDLSKTLLDGRLPSYTVMSRDAPAPCTPCILVVVDRTGLYQGTWMDDGQARTQIGWGASGDEERYYFTPTASSSEVEHTYDYATLTRHGSLVELTGYYHLEPDEQVKTSSHYLNWISVPAAWQPPHDLSSLVVPEVISSANSNGVPYLVDGRHYPFVQVKRGNLPSYTVWLQGFYQYLAAVNFHLVWMTDALTAAPGASSRMLTPSPDQTTGSAAMQEPAQQTQTAPTQTANTQAAAPAGDATQQTPAVQAPAVQEPAPQATQAQGQTPAAQPDASQAPAQQEQTATQAPAVQAAQEQTPAQASPAHAAPEQAKDVQAPAVQDAPAHAASTARHAKPGLEE